METLKCKMWWSDSVSVGHSSVYHKFKEGLVDWKLEIGRTISGTNYCE